MTPQVAENVDKPRFITDYPYDALRNVNSPQVEPILEVLTDRTSLAIFSRVHERPRSAKTLEEICDASLKTIYRRIEALEEAGLVSAVSRIDEDGNHYTAYTTAVEEVEITVEPADPDIVVDIRTGDDVETFVGVWRELQH